MKRNYTSELYARISSESLENDSDAFEVISIRTRRETSSAVQAIAAAFQIPATTLFTDKISQLIAEKLVESNENKGLIKEELENGFSPGSALDILRNEKIITIENPFITRGLKSSNAQENNY